MDDLISRQAVEEIINDIRDCISVEGYWAILERLKKLPSVKPQEPKTGHWEWQTEDIYRCSECSEDIHVKEVMNVPQYEWCPMCGARMVEPQESEVRNDIIRISKTA